MFLLQQHLSFCISPPLYYFCIPGSISFVFTPFTCIHDSYTWLKNKIARAKRESDCIQTGAREVKDIGEDVFYEVRMSGSICLHSRDQPWDGEKDKGEGWWMEVNERSTWLFAHVACAPRWRSVGVFECNLLWWILSLLNMHFDISFGRRRQIKWGNDCLWICMCMCLCLVLFTAKPYVHTATAKMKKEGGRQDCIRKMTKKTLYMCFLEQQHMNYTPFIMQKVFMSCNHIIVWCF